MRGQVIGSRRVIVKNPDGTTRIIQQAITSPAVGTQKAATNTITPAPAVSSAGNAAGSAPQTQQQTPAPQQHKVQIIRGPDGKVSVRGLNPGQQLIQMPDGKLHVLTTTTTAASTGGTPG